MNVKRILIASCTILITISVYATPRDIVFTFGQYMSEWCNTDDFTYREKIEALCSGIKSCRVEDKIHADYQRKRGYMDYETYVLDSYLNMFQTLISSGVQFDISNIVVETQDEYPDGQVLTFITADIKVSGVINYSVKDLFLVRDNKISGIYTYSSIYGFQHLNGSLITELERGKYTCCIQPFKNGYAVIGINRNKLCVIDKKGVVVFPLSECETSSILISSHDNSIFGEGVFAKGFPTGEVYDLRKRTRLPFNYFWLGMDYKHDSPFMWERIGVSGVPSTDKYTNGNPFFEYASIENKEIYKEGYCVVCKIIENKEYFSYASEMDVNFSNLNFIYDEASHFQNGLARVVKNERSMIINKNFDIVVFPPSGHEICSDFYFDSDLIKIINTKTKLQGVMNFKGDIIIPCSFSKLYCSHNGLAVARKTEDGLYGFINTLGDLIIPYKYKLAHYFDNNVCWVCEDVSNVDEYDIFTSRGDCQVYCDLIDQSGRVLLSSVMPNDYFSRFEEGGFYNGYTKVSKIIDNIHLSAVINSKGQTKKGFDWQHNYLGSIQQTDLICYAQDNKVGYVNQYGVIIIPPTFDDGRDFSESGFATISKLVNGHLKYGFIKKNGEYLLPPTFDYAESFIEQRAVVGKYSGNLIKYGYVDNNGKLILNTEYDYASEFMSDGYACVGKNIGNETKYGIINQEGVLIYPCIFDNWNIRFDNGIALVEKDGKLGLIDLFGNSYFFRR